MQYVTPGVHIRHVLTEPKRVLHTGVPVFLGLISKKMLKTHNSFQDDDYDKFIEKPIPNFPEASIARKPGYVRLPERPGPDREGQLGDSSIASSQSYLRAVIGSQAPSTHNLEQVQFSGGAAGQPDEAGIDQAASGQTISGTPQRFTLWPQFHATYGSISRFGYLTHAVRGFFENRGTLCYVQLISYEDDMLNAVEAGLQTLEISSEYDLVCVPDLMWPSSASGPTSDQTLRAMQSAIIQHCQNSGDRFAILDSRCSTGTEHIKKQRDELRGDAAALYYPWLCVPNGPQVSDSLVPPCGHVAGVYARTDQSIGVFKAPANEILEGVQDLAIHLTGEQQGQLNPYGINCIRSFPRRGIRIWGARTLSASPSWKYVNVRRIFTTAVRWIERNMRDVVFEPNTPELWRRIERDLNYYFANLLEQGALAGSSVEEAFYVKCDAETNPPELREVGQVVTEIGFAPAAPAEFIVVRIMHGQTGVRIIGSA